MAKSAAVPSAAQAVFKALADPTRRAILANLAQADMGVGEIVGRFDISGPSISRHLSLLRAAGLVKERRAANRVIYALQPEVLTGALSSFLSQFSGGPGRDRGKRSRDAGSEARESRRKPTGATSKKLAGASADGPGRASGDGTNAPTPKKKGAPAVGQTGQEQAQGGASGQRQGPSSGQSWPSTPADRPVNHANS